MSEAPYMQLWVADFLGDTLHLSAEEVGQYMLLLMAMWRQGGSLSDNTKTLERIARGPVSDGVMLMFSPCLATATISQKRLLAELERSRARQQHAREAGSKGGKAKALNHNDVALANATNQLQQKATISEPEPLATKVAKKRVPNENLFLEFWEAYPRKVAKGDALKAYLKALSRASHAEIVAGAKRYKPDPKFTKHPATWLNADCWLDEVPKTNGTVAHGPWKPLPSVVDPVKPPSEDRERQLQRLLKARAM
jgi:uncharacterized protein YdaU (DUF1376 family)